MNTFPAKLISLLLFSAMACSPEKEAATSITLAAPGDLTVEQVSSESVRLSWKDNAADEEGYYVFSGANVRPVATLPPDSESYVVEGLPMGSTCYFGVRAFGKDHSLSPLVSTDRIRILSADERNYVDDGSRKVGTPAFVEAFQSGADEATVCWEDPSGEAEGYNVYLRDTSDTAFRLLAGTVGKGTFSLVLKGLSQGVMYVAGVQSLGSSTGSNSRAVPTEAFSLSAAGRAPSVSLEETESFPACISVRYRLDDLTGAEPEHGICLSTDRIPTTEDIVFPGPKGRSGLQVLSAAVLEPGREYRLRGYVRHGDTYRYSRSRKTVLPEQAPALTFHWTEVTGLGLPGSIRVYRTEDPLNGRPFHAWYAEADCTGPDVEFRVLYPDALATVDAQAEAAGDCYVLVNGGIFGSAANGSLPIGFAVSDGVQTPWRAEVDAEYWGSDGRLYPVSRGLFGVDRNGKPATGWSYTPRRGSISVYGQPVPSVSGEALYEAATETFPGPPSAWVPFQAITCGPVVLQDGICPVNLEKTASGGWMTNFELWANDVFATHPDRTCVGYTPEGKIILFICDGRIAESDGAYPEELGSIMKGLGCIGALNLDGGGSTGMWAGGKHLNSLKTGSADPLAPDQEYNRPVRTTLGFFRKR